MRYKRIKEDYLFIVELIMTLGVYNLQKINGDYA